MTLILCNVKVHLETIAQVSYFFSHSFEVLASLIIKMDIQ